MSPCKGSGITVSSYDKARADIRGTSAILDYPFQLTRTAINMELIMLFFVNVLLIAVEGENNCVNVYIGKNWRNDENRGVNCFLSNLDTIKDFNHLACINVTAEFDLNSIDSLVKFMHLNRSPQKYLWLKNFNKTHLEDNAKYFKGSVFNFDTYFGNTCIPLL